MAKHLEWWYCSADDVVSYTDSGVTSSFIAVASSSKSTLCHKLVLQQWNLRKNSFVHHPTQNAG